LPALAPTLLEVPPIDVAGTFALVGRTLGLFAGAYLWRALTESGVLDRGEDATLGLVYALALAALVYHVAPRCPVSATFFGACAVIVGLPLVADITTGFACASQAQCSLRGWVHAPRRRSSAGCFIRCSGGRLAQL
jgi:hypothetical protein